MVMQLWNIYRSRAIGFWLQVNGVKVIPNLRFGDRRTYRICCDGIEKHCVIAVGSHGNLKLVQGREIFLKGLDVVVHGNPNTVSVMKNGDWVELDHRRLAKFLKSDRGYSKGNIRLISCSTGKESKGFAQNLANKMGVSVMAPSDTLYIYPNGKVVIGPNQFKNTGKWITYHPERKDRK